MNREKAEGKLDEMKGKGQAVGWRSDRQPEAGQLRCGGPEFKGAAKEAWGDTKDAAKSIANDAHSNAEGHAQDVRAKITSTAQNAKEAVSEKADQIRAEHKRSA